MALKGWRAHSFAPRGNRPGSTRWSCAMCSSSNRWRFAPTLFPAQSFVLRICGHVFSVLYFPFFSVRFSGSEKVFFLSASLSQGESHVGKENRKWWPWYNQRKKNQATEKNSLRGFSLHRGMRFFDIACLSKRLEQTTWLFFWYTKTNKKFIEYTP